MDTSLHTPPNATPSPGPAPAPAAWAGPGILFAVLAMASLSFSDATSKWVMLSVTPLTVLWFLYAVQAVGTALVLAPLRGRAMWRTHSLRWQLLRGLLMVSCILLAFYCLQRMPVAEFTATVMLTPLVLTALARFVMKEQVSPLRWLMVVGGLIGALPDRRFEWALGPLVAAAWGITASRLGLRQLLVQRHPVGYLLLGATWAVMSGMAVSLYSLRDGVLPACAAATASCRRRSSA